MASCDPYASLGELRKTKYGRWVLNGSDLSSGSVFEVRIQGHWIRVVIEYHDAKYQPYPESVNLHQGLRARFIGEYTDD